MGGWGVAMMVVGACRCCQRRIVSPLPGVGAVSNFLALPCPLTSLLFDWSAGCLGI